jgi:hypothetical protein
MESQMRLSCQSIFIMSEDGSVGKRGTLADALIDVLARYPIDHIFIAASSKIIQEILPLTREKSIKLKAVLLPLALSGVGLCALDQIRVGKNYVSFAEQGPIFDAGQIDFDIYDTCLARVYGEYEKK